MPNYKRYYVENSYVFITVVTYNRKPILIQNINSLRNSFHKAKQLFEFEIFASVILPEHFHVIIKPAKTDDFSKIIGVVKRTFTQSLIDIMDNDAISDSRIKRNEKGIWQRRFYEHLIRDESDLHNHLDYIHYNPVKHESVKSVKDWEYSSFKKFVERGHYQISWGDFSEDTKHFNNLNYE